MRIDKYLKISRLIKRREAAKILCDNHCVLINARLAKSASEIKVGDIVAINSPNGKKITVKVIAIPQSATVETSKDMYAVLSQE